MNGTKTDVLPPASAISCSVGRPVVLIDAPPPKRKLLRWIIISPNGTVKIKSLTWKSAAPTSERRSVRGVSCSALASKTVCALHLHSSSAISHLQDQIFFFSYRRQNPWQPIACFGGGNTEGTSKHHQGDKTRRHSRCRYCNIFVMNGEFTPFSCPVVCLHCRNLGWIYSHGCWQYLIITFSHSLPLLSFWRAK